MKRTILSHVVPACALAGAAAAALAQPPPPDRAEVQVGDPLTREQQQHQAIGTRFVVKIENLPGPYQSPPVRNPPVLLPRGERVPTVPPGFEVTLFADGLDAPRQLLLLPNGDAVVAMQAGGYLMMLRDSDGDGSADFIQRHASQFNGPYGLAYRDGEILVTDQDGIWSVAYTEGELRPAYAEAEPASEVPLAERKPMPYMDAQQRITPTGVFGLIQGHTNRDLAIGRDGRLLVGVGSVGNIGIEPAPKATIQAFDRSGSNQTTYASGLRNPSGLAVHPETGALWAVVQERDGMGDLLVPDFLAEIKANAFYGYPYAYIGTNPQPEFAKRAPDKVAATVKPDLLFEPHSAAMDLTFYQGDSFPEHFQGDAFVAMRGSWNSANPVGYKVVRVPFQNGRPADHYENFMTGFWVAGTQRAEIWGRPTDVEVGPDGALYVLDEPGGTLWRVTYSGGPTAAEAPAGTATEPSAAAAPAQAEQNTAPAQTAIESDEPDPQAPQDDSQASL